MRLLVDSTPETTLMDIGAIRYELRKLLDAFRECVLTEALPV